MRKFRFFYFSAIVAFLIISVNLIGCSRSELTDDSSMLRTQSEIEALKIYFKDEVMDSDEYLTYINSIKIFSEKRGNDCPTFSSREQYKTWLHNNLSSTQFASEDEGLECFDKTITDYTKLKSKFPDFFIDLKRCSNRELTEILIAVTPIPEYGNQQNNECLTGCAGTAAASYAAAVQQYSIAMAEAIAEDNDALCNSLRANLANASAAADAYFMSCSAYCPAG